MDFALNSVEIAAIAFGMLLFADFLSGFFHWLEDSFGDRNWPILGKLVTEPNILHHFDPRHMTYHSWLDSARGPLVGSGIALAIAYFAGMLSWPVILLAAIVSNSNEIHKWAHRSKAENGRLISFFQRTGLIQSRAHHASHHQHLKDSHYCVVTGFLNPVLERIRFWRTLEALIRLGLRVHRREDPSIGPARFEYPVPICTGSHLQPPPSPPSSQATAA